MATVSQKTLHWLYSVLSNEYQDSNRAYSDLVQSLERFPSISPRTDVYTFENGSSSLLVHLLGTLPVAFRNMTYRFPIEIWIPHTYPFEPPIAYITPTSDMLIRPGRHVSGEGRVYHPYLAHWAEAWDRSSLVELLSILCGVFSREPPVMSRQQAPEPPPLSSRPPPPVPPLPFERSGISPQASVSSATPVTQPNPPRPPPKQRLEADTQRVPRAIPPSRYDAPPALPDAVRSASSQSPHTVPQLPQLQLPALRQSSLRQSVIPPQVQQQAHFHQARNPLIGANVRYSAPSAQVPHQHASSVTPPSNTGLPYWQSSASQSPSPFPNPSQPPQPSSGTQSQFPPHLQPTPRASTRFQQPPVDQPQLHPKPHAVNLLDSPFDINLPVSSSANIPAPPIPPNPEKDALLSALSQSITQALHNGISQNAASLPLLRSQNEALNNAVRTLETEVAQLQALQGTLSSNVSILQSSLREADQCISSAHARAQRGEISKIDEMITAPTVVGKQLYDVVCDERGIEAAVWALQAALTRGMISMEVWAKKTRELSRDGFRRKVLSRKIAAGMGLEG